MYQPRYLRRLAVVLLAMSGSVIIGQAPAPIALTSDEITYSVDGLALPGMGQALLVGSPSNPGRYTVRLRFPDGYKIEPHYHPDAREVTILSGTYLTGYGEVFDAGQLKALPAGSFYTEPANLPHFIVTKGPVEIQVSGVGPSARTFVHAAP